MLQYYLQPASNISSEYRHTPLGYIVQKNRENKSVHYEYSKNIESVISCQIGSESDCLSLSFHVCYYELFRKQTLSLINFVD